MYPAVVKYNNIYILCEHGALENNTRNGSRDFFGFRRFPCKGMVKRNNVVSRIFTGPMYARRIKIPLFPMLLYMQYGIVSAGTLFIDEK